MSALGRFLIRIGQKLNGVWYEGPKPPKRLEEIVISYAKLYPHATREEWIAFAMLHGNECYASGYTRGHEYAEREQEDPKIGAHTPEEFADLTMPGWRDRPYEFDWDGSAVTADEGVPYLEREVGDEDAFTRLQDELNKLGALGRTQR